MIISNDNAQLNTASVNAVEAEKDPAYVVKVPVRVMVNVPTSELLLVSIVSLPIVIGGPAWYNY